MSATSQAIGAILPTVIQDATVTEPTLLLGGANWSMSATCDWRWQREDGSEVTQVTPDVEDLVWELVGDVIVNVTWSSRGHDDGSDPTLLLKSGGVIQIVSDASYDSWVLHTPNLVLVGPLM